ncbi:NUDIX domain-containing protein [Ditylenchus destructor]|nr:NUDIX domain-containing protein [Ditylenchus destructor]
MTYEYILCIPEKPYVGTAIFEKEPDSDGNKQIFRVHVDDDKVYWNVDLLDYNPEDYSASWLKSKYEEDEFEWIDHWDPNMYKNVYNQIDEKNLVNRISYPGPYSFDKYGRPLNPMGRTGLRGRGMLGAWGPCHAADAIISRFRPGTRILEAVLVRRKDNNKWAMSGGFVDRNMEEAKDPSIAAIREFTEEALNNKEDAMLEVFWNNSKVQIYEGYVDDERNTDNSWMITNVYNFHDNDFALDLKLEKQELELVDVKWVTMQKGWPNLDQGEEVWEAHMPFLRLFAATHGVEI